MWKLNTSERIAQWRNFRKNLNQFDIDEAVRLTVDFWHGCPFVPYYLDPEQPDAWPTPWELVSENYYCDLAKCLGLLYTLYFTDHGSMLDPEIRVYYDSTSRHAYNLAVLCQGKYVLNFRDGDIVNIEQLNKTLVLQHCYTEEELKLNEY